MRRGCLVAVVIVGLGVGSSDAAIAGDPPPDNHIGAQAENDGEDVTGTAESRTPGEPGGDPRYEPGTGTQWPICWNDGLYYTTQDEQLNDIRADETAGREGQWGWLICEDEDGTRTEELTFFPAAVQVDPEMLARSVTITPGVPDLRTSPPRDAQHMVRLPTWFWVDAGSWSVVTDGTCAGPVCVEVTAMPTTLVVDPGDGSPLLECHRGGMPYRDDLAPEAQQSDCTHVYERAGHLTATVTIVYDVTWRGAGQNGALGTLTPDAVPVALDVAEAQSLNTGG